VKTKLVDRWRNVARRLRLETWALYYAYRNPKTPWYAKAWGAVVVAYAFSPIDLVPDFIPILGYLDDLILVPLGIALAIRLIPKDVYEESRALAARKVEQKKPRSWMAGTMVIATWICVAAVISWLVVKSLRNR
jgi:uncharacterized membrane protein YkvA (DUF1232 family)